MERHQTLRHAVQWSYDLLDDDEKALLDRCSVFAGGFDLAERLRGWRIPTTSSPTLDLLDALVRKSLLVADRSAGRTRYSMLETIRQFAEEQLVARGEATQVRTAHARYFAGPRSRRHGAVGQSRQREAYDWFAAELPTCAPRFAGPPTTATSTWPRTIAVYASFLGYMAENYEPIAWAEELIEPARAIDHPRLAALYVLASQCYMAGRPEAAVHYGEAGQAVVSLRGNNVRFGIQGWLGGGYTFTGQPERAVRWCRAELARDRDTHTLSRASLILALATAGESEAAMTEAQGLVEAAEERENPCVLSYALLACGFALRTTDPDRALDTLRRGLAIAEASGNRSTETSLAGSLCRLEAEQGDPKIAVAYFPVAIRNYHDSGNTTAIKVPLAVLASFLDRLGIYEPAAVLIGYALTPVTAGWIPRIKRTIVHLRDVLGDQTYEALARKGEAMTIAAIVAYAYDQIDQARAALEQLP